MARRVTVIPASPTKKSDSAEKKTVRVAAYCRVSTDREEQLGSFANQVDYYKSLISITPGWEPAGIFCDEGISGTGTHRRQGFTEMIRACEDGKVDLVITKSISRFARNTADCLIYSRHLKSLGIPIIFEKENINTSEASGELLFTILSSLAQEESRNISENTAWGIRSKFRRGIPHFNTGSLFGYTRDEEGNLIADPAEAPTVRRVFYDFLDGWTVSEISRRLNEDEVPGARGSARWAGITVERMLRNEKYTGDLLLQKTYTADFLVKRRIVNRGELERYYVRDDHEAIIPREDWEAAQLEFERREEYKRKHGIVRAGSGGEDRFFARVFCAHCGSRLGILRRIGGEIVRVCPRSPVYSRERRESDFCSASPVSDSVIGRAVVLAWNSAVSNRAKLLPGWERVIADGDALRRRFAGIMAEGTKSGPLEKEDPALTRRTLSEIYVASCSDMEVVFLDGSRFSVDSERGTAELR